MLFRAKYLAAFVVATLFGCAIYPMHNPRFGGMQAILLCTSPERRDVAHCRQQLGLAELPDPAGCEGELRTRCERAHAIQRELFDRLAQDEPDAAGVLDRWQEAAYRESRFVDEREAGDTRMEVAALSRPALSPQMLIHFGQIGRLGIAGRPGTTFVLYPPIEPQTGGTCGWNAVDYLPALERFLGCREGQEFLRRIADVQGNPTALLEENMLFGAALSRIAREAESEGHDAFFNMIQVADGLRDQMATDRPVGVSLHMLYGAIANWFKSGFVRGPIVELRQQMRRAQGEPLFRLGFRMGCDGQKNMGQLCAAMRDGRLPMLRFLTVTNMGGVPHVVVCALIKSPRMTRPIAILINSNRMPVVGSAHWAMANKNCNGQQLYAQESSRLDYVVGLMHCLAASAETPAAH